MGALDCTGGEATEMTARAMKDVDGVLKVITTKPPQEGVIEGVEIHFVDGVDFFHFPIAAEIYGDFLPKALQPGSYVPALEQLVVWKGLENVQEAVDTAMKGMSAKKAVVTL